jgi:hypothetical protein
MVLFPRDADDPRILSRQIAKGSGDSCHALGMTARIALHSARQLETASRGKE